MAAHSLSPSPSSVLNTELKYFGVAVMPGGHLHHFQNESCFQGLSGGVGALAVGISLPPDPRFWDVQKPQQGTVTSEHPRWHRGRFAGGSSVSPAVAQPGTCVLVLPLAAEPPPCCCTAPSSLKRRGEGESPEFNLNHISPACSFLNQYCFLHHI